MGLKKKTQICEANIHIQFALLDFAFASVCGFSFVVHCSELIQ